MVYFGTTISDLSGAGDWFTMSSMKTRHSQEGSAALVVVLVLLSMLLVGALGFGYWAFSERQDYKNNSDQKVAAAVEQAKQDTSILKDKQFAEESKSPFRTYVGPSAFGSVILKYPKTWSAYVISHTDSAPYVDGYFAKGTVPDAQAENSVFALRIRVSGESYADIMSEYTSAAQDGTTKISAYKLPKVPSVVGSKVTGTLTNNKQGTLIVLPLRANALEIWTESDSALADFNKNILPNISFSP